MSATAHSLEDLVRSLEQRNAALVEENERLLLERYHAQAERDRLDARGEGDYLGRFWMITPPAQWTIDLRRGFEGTNWYEVERDGCWAGPGSLSTLRLPPLPPLTYELALDIVDAMDPAIVANLQLSVNGQAIAQAVGQEGYAAPAVTRFNAADVPARAVWELQLRFHSLMSPAQHGSDDHRKLAIRLRAVTLKISE
jgi:hypothetical protein